jgi:uncharacterized protein
MTHCEYKKIEAFMLSQMQDSAHDRHHIYRVLNSALDISNYETAVDLDVLIAACLLHDIGRERQFANLNLCHAQIGGDIAYEYLISRKWDEAKAIHVKKCISSHRYRRDNPPETIEAKILFDADKLDASGAIGIARTLIYEGQVSEPLYLLDDNENIIVDGGGAEISSFFQEYNYKLKKLYNAFNTERAKEIAIVRQKTAVDFYDGLFNEVSQNYKNSSERLSKVLTH